MKNMKWAVLCAAAGSVHAAGNPSNTYVQVYGVVDVAFSSYYGQGNGTRNSLTSGGNQVSRIGFRGREDLGEGMYAGFDLEAGLNIDSGQGQPTNTNNLPSGSARGAMAFNRKSYVYVGGRYGTLRLGRDYTPAFWNLFAYDPFRVGVGIGSLSTHGTGATSFRASNSVGYFSPGCATFSCKGLFLQAMQAFGDKEKFDAGHDGNLQGIRVGYGGKGWDIAASIAVTKTANVGNYTQSNIGASYQWGEHRLMVLAGENRTGERLASMGDADRVRYGQIGAWIALGADYIPVSFTYLKRNDTADSSARKFAVGYVHALSKRTVVYGTYAFISNGGMLRLPVSSGSELGPIPQAGGRASGIDLGIRHVF